MTLQLLLWLVFALAGGEQQTAGNKSGWQVAPQQTCYIVKRGRQAIETCKPRGR